MGLNTKHGGDVLNTNKNNYYFLNKKFYIVTSKHYNIINTNNKLLTIMIDLLNPHFNDKQSNKSSGWALSLPTRCCSAYH